MGKVGGGGWGVASSARALGRRWPVLGGGCSSEPEGESGGGWLAVPPRQGITNKHDQVPALGGKCSPQPDGEKAAATRAYVPVAWQVCLFVCMFGLGCVLV